jgi:putative flippase GtrA
MEIKKRKDTSRLMEYAKFFVTGVINTGVDFAVLNALLWTFGPKVTGLGFIACKIVSFVAAVLNSYYLNKYWVFTESTSKNTSASEGGRFFMVSAAGFLLNITSSALVFSALKNAGAIGEKASANIAAIVGTLLVLVWNYAGYKFFVFNGSIKQRTQ